MGQHWMTLVVAISASTLNCLGRGEGHGSGGALRLPTSSSVWRGEGTGFSLCAAGRSNRALLACSAVRAFSASLLDCRPVPGLGVIPSVNEVVRDARFV